MPAAAHAKGGAKGAGEVSCLISWGDFSASRGGIEVSGSTGAGRGRFVWFLSGWRSRVAAYPRRWGPG
ncbi:MAG: hypothetical protein ACTSQ8_20370 [Candidatus Helarchaeota archaeon]